MAIFLPPYRQSNQALGQRRTDFGRRIGQISCGNQFDVRLFQDFAALFDLSSL